MKKQPNTKAFKGTILTSITVVLFHLSCVKQIPTSAETLTHSSEVDFGNEDQHKLLKGLVAGLSQEFNLPQNNFTELASLGLTVILNDESLVASYYREASHLDSPNTKDCLWYSPNLESLVNRYIRLTQALLIRGIPVNISLSAKSALTAVQSIKDARNLNTP